MSIAIIGLFFVVTFGCGTVTIVWAPGLWKLVGIPLLMFGLMAIVPPPAALTNAEHVRP